jgi:TIR domain/Pentapeptide repeats (8 copies)
MANREQVELLRQDVAAWNTWRRRNFAVLPDLSGADLSGTNLSEAGLYDTNLSGANLRGAALFSADLRRADLEFAGLSGADLFSVDLSEANLRRADLRDANLGEADLFGVDLSGADLSGADLKGANLTEASLHHTNLSMIRLFCTTVAWVDLRTVEGLDTIIHEGPSTINVNTVRLPDGKTRTLFLRGAGFSDRFIDAYVSLFTSVLQQRACFISYVEEDQALARRLYHDLQDHGIRCWLTPHQVRPGARSERGIDDTLHFNEAVLLLLSEHAVRSEWVRYEVETVFEREIMEQRDLLFPLRVDETVLQSTDDWATHICARRYVGDFAGWQDDASYQQRFAELLQHLEGKTKTP